MPKKLKLKLKDLKIDSFVTSLEAKNVRGGEDTDFCGFTENQICVETTLVPGCAQPPGDTDTCFACDGSDPVLCVTGNFFCNPSGADCE